MSVNNDVHSVLITSGDHATLLAGLTLDDLLLGQLGMFDYETNLCLGSLAPSSLARKYYFAVGIDSDGMGVKNDVKKSAGQFIPKKHIRDYTFREHTASQSMLVDISDMTASCDTEYMFRVEFRNDQIFRTQGNNAFTKIYNVVTACCDECENCPSADANEITRLFLAEVNMASDPLLTAIAITPNALTIVTEGVSQDYSAGDEILDVDILALEIYNALDATDEEDKRYTNIRLEPNDLKINQYCNTNLKYYYPRKNVIIVTLAEGFDCKGIVTIFQDPVFEEGNGYDLKQQEYHAGAHSGGGPYKVSDLNGVADDFRYYANVVTKYDQMVISYDNYSSGGFEDHRSPMSTTIAVPIGDDATMLSLVLGTDQLTLGQGFDALLLDVAARDQDPNVVSTTSSIDDFTLDGLS